MLVVFALLTAETVISNIIAQRTDTKEVNLIMDINSGIVAGGKNSIGNKKLKVIILQSIFKINFRIIIIIMAVIGMLQKKSNYSLYKEQNTTGHTVIGK